METLPYCPKPNYTVSNEPKIKKMDFGDGYQQRRADGLNPLLRKFSVTFNLRNPQAVKLAQFLAKHKGVTAFLFKAENAKVSVRNARRDAIDGLKKAQKEGMPEDVAKDGETSAQKLHDKYMKKIDDMFAEKEKEILTV